MHDGTIKAVLGPTNTGKTHLAIERMCAHSSGAMGFPLRLLAREVFDRVRALKGDAAVALITGEERIEPPDARYLCCTVEAMPRHVGGDGGGRAFVALDEAQLGADRERGHVFTDRLLNTRGREETMILGAATLAPLVRALVPEAEITERPRFSTLRHIGPRKLSRLPPRSAVVAFSTEQVYAVAEMLRRFRGGAAVVTGGLSPQTRNRQVALFQDGTVDYIVATDAIGMGLNLDVTHVAFAGLSKFDGVRRRRLEPAELAQIAGRAGRHQKDGTFGTLAGMRHSDPAAELSEEEVYAIEEHRFAPITKLFWRNAEPRFDSIAALIADLERPPKDEMLRLAPEAIDLATLKRLAEDPVARGVSGPGAVRRFWEACSLPDFRARGAEVHARFVARLWKDLREGHIGADFVAARISELDNMAGDIDTIEGRIAAIRSWAYICQRPDWVLARDEMGARARTVEAKLSDALHARLTERFVNRRTTILMKSLGENASALPISVDLNGLVHVEDEAIGRIEGLRFEVDRAASHGDRKMLLAAAEKAMPRLLGERVAQLLQSGLAEVELSRGAIRWGRQVLATIAVRKSGAPPSLVPARELGLLTETDRAALLAALDAWLAQRLAPLAPLTTLEQAARSPDVGSQGRALLLNLIEGHGFVPRERAGLDHLPAEMRPVLRRLGVTFGALDVFASALLKPAPRRLLGELGIDRRPVEDAMLPVIAARRPLPSGYRLAGSQAIRLDLAERIVRLAHEARSRGSEAKGGARSKGARGGARRRGRFAIDTALPVSIGLEADNIARLLGQAGFRRHPGRAPAPGAHGPVRPDLWEWRPARRQEERAPPAKPVEGHAFAALASLVR